MIAAPLALGAFEGGAVADRDHRILERSTARVVRMRIAGGNRLHAQRLGKLTQLRVPTRVASLVRALELDEEPVAAEGAGELGGRVRVTNREPVARAAGEADEPLVQLGQECGIERRRQQLALLRPSSGVGRGQQAAEVRVPTLALDEQGHVRSAAQRHLRAGDRPHAERLRRVRELERAVDAVVVGESKRLVPELGRPRRQLLRV